MKRILKKHSGIYEYLNEQGLLNQGTEEMIALAKKQYWAAVRKAWKEKRRKEQKGYTVFVTKDEISSIRKVIQDRKGGIAGYIKQATLAAAAGTHSMDKKVVGQVRELLFQHYNKVSAYTTGISMSEEVSEVLLYEIETLQHSIIAVLQGTKEEQHDH